MSEQKDEKKAFPIAEYYRALILVNDMQEKSIPQQLAQFLSTYSLTDVAMIVQQYNQDFKTVCNRMFSTTIEPRCDFNPFASKWKHYNAIARAIVRAGNTTMVEFLQNPSTTLELAKTVKETDLTVLDIFNADGKLKPEYTDILTPPKEDDDVEDAEDLDETEEDDEAEVEAINQEDYLEDGFVVHVDQEM